MLARSCPHSASWSLCCLLLTKPLGVLTKPLGASAIQSNLLAPPSPHSASSLSPSPWPRIQSASFAYPTPGPPRVPACVRIRPHTSAYVSIRQHTSAYVTCTCMRSLQALFITSANVSIGQHTPEYVSIRQNSSACMTCACMRSLQALFSSACTWFSTYIDFFA